MSPHELLKQAQANGLTVTSHGVNLAAFGPPKLAGFPEGAKVSEKDFQAQVFAILRWGGWRIAHFRSVRVARKNRASGQMYYDWQTPVAEDGAGFPDIEAVRERIVKIELKVRPNKLEPEQEAWRDAYLKAGVEWYVWYPEDLQDIVRIMK